jgi:ADP-ribose pyrophosphatase
MRSSRTEIRQIEEILAYGEDANPWLKLYFDRVEFPDGRVGRYNRIVESDGRPGVAVLPIAPGQVGLVRLFRYPVGAHVWEIPRGFGDAEHPEDDVRRELREETGLSAGRLLELGRVHPNTGILASGVWLYGAMFEQQPIPTQPTDKEIDEFKWFAMRQVLSMIGDGTITDVFTIAAVARADYRGLLHG